MNSLYQPGHHLDADILSAFVEQALPPHEQRQTLAHLASCPDCRHLVYLAQQADPIELEAFRPQLPTVRRPWFLSWNLAWPTAALAALILLTIVLHHPDKPETTTATADSVQPLPSQPSPPIAPTLPAPPTAAQSKIIAPRPTQLSPSRSLAFAKDQRQSLGAPMAQTATGSISAAATSDQAIALAPPPPPTAGFGGGLSLARTAATGSTIHGTITDLAGAAIPRARITATNTLTGTALTRETSSTGDFFLSPLPPGTYNVEAAAPGFQRLLQKDVQVAAPTQLALNLKLPIGAANETVTVTSAPSALDTTNATLGGTIENQLYTDLPLQASAAKRRDSTALQNLQPGVAQQASAVPSPTAAPAGAQQGVYGGTGQTNLNENYVNGIPADTINAAITSKPAALAVPRAAAAPALMAKKQPTLPSHLPTLSTIANARLILALDTAGTLFRSEDAGVTWLPVASQWKGRATRLTLIPVATPSTLMPSKVTADQRAAPGSHSFQLTTDTGAAYTSPDGQTWHIK